MQVPLGAPQPKSGRFRRSTPADSGVAGVPAESGSPGATGQAGPADSLGSSRAPDGSGAPARAGGPGNRLPPPSAPPPQMGGHGGSSTNGQLGSPLGSGDGRQSRLLVLLCVGALILALLLVIGGLLAPRLLDAVDGDGDNDPGRTVAADTSDSIATSTSTASTLSATARPNAVLTAIPTSQPTLTGGSGTGPEQATVTATVPLDGGMTVGVDRRDPVPLGMVGVSADGAWQVALLEQHRGDEAQRRLTEANQFNEPAPDGMQYIVLLLEVTYQGEIVSDAATPARHVDVTYISGTGDAHVRWQWPGVVDPDPLLSATLVAGESTRGWATLRVGADETNLQLLFEPFLSDAEGDEIYMALDANASVEPIVGPLARADEVGTTAEDAVPLGVHVTSTHWQVWVEQVLSGDTAFDLLRTISVSLPAPDDGMEYLVIEVAARNISAEPDLRLLVPDSFRMRQADGTPIQPPSAARPPEPELWYEVYPGGQVQGWLVRQRPVDASDAVLVYTPLFGETEPERFLLLVPGSA